MGNKLNSTGSKTEPKGMSSSPSILCSLIIVARQSPLLECAHFSGQRQIKIAAVLPNRHSHQPIHHPLALSAPGTRTPCGQTTAWPRSAAGPWYTLAAMSLYCTRSLPTVTTAIQNISSPTSGRKNTKTQRRGEKHSFRVFGWHKNVCGTHIFRLLFGFESKVLLVCDEWSREILHLKALGFLLRFLPEDVWLCGGEVGGIWRSKWSSMTVVWSLKTWVSGILLLVLSLCMLCWKFTTVITQSIMIFTV